MPLTVAPLLSMNEGRVRKRAYRSKVRRVTACVECHRRKQKCDRKNPCNVCVDRGVPAQCIYYSETQTSQPAYRSPVSSRSVNSPESPLTFDQSQLSVLTSEMGYSGGLQNGTSSAPNSTVISGIRTAGWQPSSLNLTRDNRTTIAKILERFPDPSTVRKLVNVFFSEANWYFCVLDRCFFDQRYRTWLQHVATRDIQLLEGENYYFVGLLFQVMAMGLHFVPSSMKTDPDMLDLSTPSFDHNSQVFSESGDAILAILGRRKPDLSSVEADVLRCAWLKNSGNGYEAWYSLAQAVRQAQDLGLHLEPVISVPEDDSPGHLQAVWNGEHKRRIWACIFTWGSHMSLQLGRPRMINITDCTARRPTDCDAPTHLGRTLLASDSQTSDVPSQYTSHIVKYDIALKMDRALTLGLLQSSGLSRYEEVLAIHAEVAQMLSTLPIAFRHPSPDTSWDLIHPVIIKHRLQIRIVADAFLLALHRPYVSSKPQSLQAAVQAAKNILDVSEQLFLTVEENQYKTFTLVFYTIDTSIFLAITMTRFNLDQYQHHHNDNNNTNADVISRDAILTSLDQSVNRLQCLEKYNSAARAGRIVIKSCLDQIHSSLSKDTSASTSTSIGTAPTDPTTHLMSPPSPLSRPTPSTTNITAAAATAATDPYLSLTETADGNDELLWNLLNDSASMFSWLENYMDFPGTEWDALGNHSYP